MSLGADLGLMEKHLWWESCGRDEQGPAGVGWRGRRGVTGQAASAVRWVRGRVLRAGEDSEHSQCRQLDFENYVKTTQRKPGQAPRGRVVTAP